LPSIRVAFDDILPVRINVILARGGQGGGGGGKHTRHPFPFLLLAPIVQLRFLPEPLAS